MENYRDLDGLVEFIEQKKQMGKKIVFTNGCYDILHEGHIHTLQKSAKLGDILIVGLNSDESVKRFKGENRPVKNELVRARILNSIKGVDYVIIFDEDEPLELLRKLKPDICVKGGNPIPERVKKEKEIVESYGGRIVCLPLVEGVSTTNIIERIRD